MYKLFLGLLFTFIFGTDPKVKTPVITGTYCTSSTITTVNGTCAEKAGTNIEVFKNGASVGTVTLNGNNWTITGVSFAPGDEITAQASNDDGQSLMSDIVTVYADPSPANAGTDQTLCNTASATLDGNIPSPGTGTWSVITGGATVDNPASNNSTVSNLAIGINTFRWTTSNPPCTSTDDVTITVKASAPVANAGPDQNLCNAGGSTLAGNNPSPGNGMWTVIAGGATVDNPTVYNSSVSNLSIGTNTFLWTISNAPCASSSDDITINVSALPSTANAGTDQTLCNTMTGQLNGNLPLTGSGMWSVIAGGATVDNPTVYNSSVSNLGIGINTFLWTISNLLCNSTDDVTINVVTAPTAANAGPDQTGASMCGLTSTTLAANSPGTGATGKWSIVSGSGGNFGNDASPTSTFSGTAGTTYVLKWTISKAPCAPSSSDVTITFEQGPTSANAGPDQTGASMCGLTSTTLAGNVAVSGTGKWSIVSGSGGSFGNDASPTSTFSGTAGTTYVLKWTISKPSCTASTDDVIITFQQDPITANAGPDQTGASMCGLTSTTLAANSPGTGTGKWSIVSGSGGNFGNDASPTSTFSGTAGTTYVLKWTISKAPCPASADDVTITFEQGPTPANAGPDQTGASMCGLTSTTLAGNVAVSGTGKWSIVSGSGGGFGNDASPTSTFSGTPGTTYVLSWTISKPSCPPSTNNVTIKFEQGPTPANAGPDQTGASMCGITSTTLAANSPGTGNGTGQWSIVSGAGGSFVSATNPTTVFNGTPGTTYVLKWTISKAPCPASADDVTISFWKSTAPAANAGPDQTGASMCGITSTTLAGNTPTVGTGQWSVVSGAGGNFGNDASPTSTFSGTAGTTYVLRWTISNSPCAASIDEVTIIFWRNPTTADAGPNQTGASMCGLTSTTLAGNTPSTGTGQWSIFSGGTGTFGNSSSPTSTFSGIAGTTYVLRWTISNPPCISFDNVTVTFWQTPTANAGPDQTICSATTTLSGNTPLAGSGTWTRVSGSGTVTVPGNPTSNVTGLAPGTSVFRWTVTNGPCTDFDEVIIDNGTTVLTVNAGPDQSICNTKTATLAGNTPASGTTGTWSVITGGATITSPSSPNSGVTNLAVGVNTFRWTIKDAACVAWDDITITISDPPTTANAGPDQTVCTNTATLAGNNPLSGKGTWTVIAGGATVTTPTNPISGVTNLAQGVNTFRWTISNAPCTATSDDITITVNGTLTTANAGADQTLCNAGTTTLAGNTPTTGTGAWTKFSGSGTITTPGSPTSGVTGLTVGTSVFVWTISNPPCTPSSDTVTVTNSTPPTVPDAGQNQTLCNTTSTLLAGNTPTIGNGMWTKVSGSGTIVTPANPTSGITGLAPGTSVFRWTITNGACAASDDVSIDVAALTTTADAGTDQTLCNATTTTLAGNAPAAGAGVWTKISGSGNITAPGSPTTGVTGLLVGTSVFRWTITSGACTSMDDVTIIISSSPTAANAGPNQTLCSSNAILAGNTPVTGTGTWTRVSGSGNITTPGNPTSGVTGLTAGTSVFKWTISNGACFSSDSMSIVNGNVPAINAGPDQNLCNSTSTTLAGNTPPSGITGVWSVIAGGATVTSPSNPTSAVTNLAVGANIFRWTITDGGCVATDSITINVNVTPTTANAGPDQTSFSSTATLSGNTPVTGTGVWTVIAGSATITTPSDPKSGVTDLSLGLNTFRWTISAPPCPNSFDEVNINVTLTNIPPDAKNDTVLIPEDSFLSINVQANDYDANFDSLITSIVTAPANGKVILNGKKIDYFPNKNFNGTDKIVYSVCDGGTPSLCDTAFVVITVTPVNDPLTVGDTSLTAHQNTSATICIPISDVDGAQAFTGSSCKDPVHGTYTSTITGNQFCVTYTPGSDYIGLDSICIVVCDNGGPSFCDTTRVFINVIKKPLIAFNVPQGFSPNGDGVNDLFVIPGIEEYPDNHIIIFNQWGNLVFEEKPYTNKWNGSHQGIEVLGNKLPSGTYYYVLDLGNGSAPIKKYVYLSR